MIGTNGERESGKYMLLARLDANELMTGWKSKLVAEDAIQKLYHQVAKM